MSSTFCPVANIVTALRSGGTRLGLEDGGNWPIGDVFWHSVHQDAGFRMNCPRFVNKDEKYCFVSENIRVCMCVWSVSRDFIPCP